MKKVLPLLVALVLSGCAGMHKPTQPEGPLHPINPAQYYQRAATTPAPASSSGSAQTSFRTVRKGSHHE